jgi:peroxiredoxin
LIKPGVPKSSAWYGIALPAIFVVNADGKISHRFSTENYRERPDVERVLTTLGKQ